VREQAPPAADSRSEQECGCRPTVAPWRTLRRVGRGSTFGRLVGRTGGTDL